MSTAARRSWIALIGTVVVIVLYYVVHRPLEQSIALGWVKALASLAVAALLTLAAVGIGRAVWGRLALGAGVEATFGFGLLGIVTLALAAVGQFQRWPLWAVLLVLVAVTFRQWWSVWAEVRKFAYQMGRLEAPFERWIAFVVGFCLVTALLFALMPPTQWDALMYHLPAAARLVRDGRLVAYPDNHYLGFPQGAGNLYAWGMALTGQDVTAAVIHWTLGIVGLFTVAQLTYQHAGKGAAWIAVLLLCFPYGLWLSYGSAYIDLVPLMFSAAVLAVLAKDRQHAPEWPYWVLLGSLIGFAVGAKYTAGLIAVAVGGVILWMTPRQALRAGAVIGIAALLAYGAWGVRGALLYENPVYPYFFGGVNWDSTRSAAFSAAGSGFLSQGRWPELLILPFAATAIGTEGGISYTFDASPLLLTLWFLVALGWHWLDPNVRPLVRVSVRYWLVMWGVWIISAALSGIGAQTRLITPAFAPLAILGGVGLMNLGRWPRVRLNVAFVMRAVVVLVTVLGLLPIAGDVIRANPLAVLWGYTPPEAYRFSRLGTHASAMAVLDDLLPANSRVLFLWEPRAYYCPPTIVCDADTLTDHWSRADEATRSAWHEDYDAVLIWWSGYTFFADGNPALAEFPVWLDAEAELLWQTESGDYALYSWQRRGT